jgi:uncharacterized DUF497 family protein
MCAFEWDGEKAEANWRRHGIRFDKAIEVFDDPRRTEDIDERFGYGEDRWWTIGMAKGGMLLFVAYATRENGTETIRIISARRATGRERRLYGNRKV